MNNEFKRLLDLSVVDGVFVSSNKSILMKKAEELGMDLIEAQILIENFIHGVLSSQDQSTLDDYDIDDDELIVRLTRYTSVLDKHKVLVQVEPFPRRVKSLSKVEAVFNQGSKALTSIAKNDTIKESIKLIGSRSQIPGGALIGKFVGSTGSSLLNNVAGVVKKELKFNELLELCNRYMVILSLRTTRSEFLALKYSEFKLKIQKAEMAPPRKTLF